MHRLALVTLLAAVALGGCTRTELRRREIQDQVTIVAVREGALAEGAIGELQRYGRESIPFIEAALGSASVTGRLNLVMALRRIGDVESVPLLGHVALHDEEEAVRFEAETTLRKWAQGRDPRAARARAALRKIEELQGRGGTG